MKKIICFVAVLVFVVGCKQSYDANITLPSTGYLAIEGFINSRGRTVITLSRTRKLVDTAVQYERRARISIEGETSGSWLLTEGRPGIYTSDSLILNAGQRYHLRIKTGNGSEYLSDYSDVRSTPPIDSISWQRKSDGMQIYLHSHDPQNDTRYYQWKTEETWEFHSAYLSNTKLVPAICPLPPLIPVFRFPATRAVDSSIFKCWRDENSTSLLLGTTEQLASDVVYRPLINIPAASWKLGVLYSLNIRQYALSKKAYQFLSLLKRNTEQLGSIFDAQPSELIGNVHCLTSPDEIVVGFIEITEEQQKRLFIDNSEVPGWNYNDGCSFPVKREALRKMGCGCYTTPPPGCEDINPAIHGIPTFAIETDLQNNIVSAYFSPTICVDCTLRGVNTKPSFWP